MYAIVNWTDIISQNKGLWVDAYKQLEADLASLSTLRRLAAKAAWLSGIPAQVRQECKTVGKLCGVSPDVVLAAQVVYDEGWEAEEFAPGHGCTSVSDDQHFGRNLDYCYPHNAADYVYKTEVEPDFLVEGMAGVLGWMAFSGPTSAGSFNQAPRCRRIKRRHTPSLLWFRDYSMWLEDMSPDRLPDNGNMWAPDYAASDFLLHFMKEDRRFLAEYHDGQLVWQRQHGVATQANTYQLIGGLRTSVEWEEDSEHRMQVAAAAGSVAKGLKAAANECTIDTFMMR